MFDYVEVEHSDELTHIQDTYIGRLRLYPIQKLERMYPLLGPGVEKEMLRIILQENAIVPREEGPLVNTIEVNHYEILK